jgi:hypothetical protein
MTFCTQAVDHQQTYQYSGELTYVHISTQLGEYWASLFCRQETDVAEPENANLRWWMFLTGVSWFQGRLFERFEPVRRVYSLQDIMGTK